MTPAPRKIAQLKLIWAGLAVLLAAFVVSMGGLNAWQLENQGVPVRGALLGSEVVRIVDCGRDPATVFQTFSCTGSWTPQGAVVETEFRSLVALDGEVLCEVYPGQRDLVLVPPGMKTAWVTWSPTDVGLVIWLVVLVLAPMVVAVIKGVQHSTDSRLGPDDPFDKLAYVWDEDPAKTKRAETVAAAIRQRVPAGGDWLDFGSGTGLLGISLLDHADQMVLADASSGMDAAASEKVDRLGLADRVSVQQLDLTAQDAQVQEFDAITSLLALHHVPDVVLAVQRLVAMLRPGGHLALADLDAEDGSFHAHGPVRPEHHGIDRAELAEWLTEAGMVDIDLSTAAVLAKNEREYPIFLAVARKL